MTYSHRLPKVAAALAAATALLTTSPTMASTPDTTAQLTGCSITGDRYTATVTIRGAAQDRPVRWRATRVDTSGDYATEEATRGTARAGRTVLRFSYDADDLLQITVREHRKILLAVRADTKDGCGITTN